MRTMLAGTRMLLSLLAAGLGAGCGAASSSSSAGSSTSTTTTVVAIGSVSCGGVVGTISFTPPLTNGGTLATTAKVRLRTTNCTTSESDVAHIARGGITAVIRRATNDCGSVLGPRPIRLKVHWTPKAVHSSAVSFSGVTVATNSVGEEGLRLPNTGGTAHVRHSFAGTDDGASSTASVFSDQTTAQVATQCGSSAGLAALTITNGSLSLG